MWSYIHIGVHSGEDDPDDHRRTSPKARRQDDPSPKNYPIGDIWLSEQDWGTS
jgi:hypothetical protein